MTSRRARLKALVLGPVLPIVFVVMWTSGFIVGPIGVSVAPPLALTLWRFIVAAVVMGVVSLLTRAPWPRGRAAWLQLVATGILMQATLFAGAYLGLSMGVSAGLAALINGASPVLVAAAGTFVLKEKLSILQWAGTALGFVGLAIAVSGELGGGSTGAGIGFILMGTVGFAAGTLIQRRTGAKMDLRTGATVQLATAAVVMAPIAALHDGLTIPVNVTSVASLLWLAIGNSGLAFAVMFFMLRTRSAADTTRIILLVPPLTSVVAWPVLGQAPQLPIWIGLVVAGVGILIASRAPRPAPGEPVAEPVLEPAATR
ncbi:MAG TPA: DMT family transporter [Stackebrandtia sp.]|jgi:drug/metabolite transporter (DMT)-like permease|uniref:DMT family transporter n=1 Tax=Stackebrandtia sp. TaxID=2023065 RepID=UPI002D70AD32|nr:DMT family transporter [Stackebrandtia sp.]HZE41794.1 DMT family transporter [Stackebrandtia sp.]